MNKSLSSCDWSLLQSFLAVAETGSLSAAAMQLGHSQPTVGRHIKTLEDTLEVTLFHRHARGLVLSPMGASIHPAVETMRTAVTQIEIAAETEAGRLEGTVPIACSVFAAHHILPPIVAKIRQAEPRINLVLKPSDDSDNLTFREADIAVRMYRPRQLDLIARHVADIQMGVFAAQSYLQRNGTPKTLEALFDHDVVGYDTSPLMIKAMAGLGHTITPDAFAVRTDNQSAYWELVRAGCGIGFTQAHLGRADPMMQELHLGIDIPSLPVWLTAHESVRRIPRVDRVWDILAAELPKNV